MKIQATRPRAADAQRLEATRAYDAAKASGDEVIPFEQAVAEIEHSRL